MAVTVLTAGLVGLPGIIGFGTSDQLLTVLGATINITGFNNFAFSMPRNGAITSLACYLRATAALTLLAPMTYTLQVYASSTPNEIFSPVPGALVNLTIPGTLSIGDTFFGATGSINVPVTAQTRLLLVASASGGGALFLGGSVVGSVSAGLGIS